MDQDRRPADTAPAAPAVSPQSSPLPDPAEDGPWYRGIGVGQWMAMTAAVLGWMFDGFEMGLYPLAAKPALMELLRPDVVEKLGPAAGEAAIIKELAARADAWYGILTAIFLFSAAAGGLVFGWLGDRIGRTRAMVLSVLAYTLFTGAGGFATEVWHLVLFRILASLGMGGEWSLGVALVMEIWPAKARPVLAGLIGAAANMGFLLIALVGVGLNELVASGGSKPTWRWLMFVGVAPAALTFVIRLFVPESHKWKEAVASGPGPRVSDLFTGGRWRLTVLAIVLSGIPLLGTWAAVQQIPNWVGDTMGKGVANAREWSQVASALGACTGTIVGALLAWRMGRRPIYFAMCLTSLAATALLFRSQHEWGAAFLMQVFLVGLTTASFYGWTPLYLPELFPTRIRATGQGLAYNFGRVFAGAGTLMLAGQVMADIKANMAAVLAGASLIYVLGLAMIWLAPETKGRPLPD